MMMSLAAAIETLRLANHVSARQAFGWQLWSMDGAAVSNSADLPTPVHAAVGTIPRGTNLVVVGGSQHDLRQGFPKPLLHFLRRAHAHGTQMVGLCTGGLALVEAGVILVGFAAVGSAAGLITREDWRFVGDWVRLKALRRRDQTAPS